MTTITLKIYERTKKGKSFLEFTRTFFQEGKEITLVEEEEKSPYNLEFVKMVLESRKDIEKGNFTVIKDVNSRSLKFAEILPIMTNYGQSLKVKVDCSARCAGLPHT
ncbi:MAG: hypothetical protein QM564_07245 [Bergeyella sp.]